jgi:hypothetical protein
VRDLLRALGYRYASRALRDEMAGLTDDATKLAANVYELVRMFQSAESERDAARSLAGLAKTERHETTNAKLSAFVTLASQYRT